MLQNDRDNLELDKLQVEIRKFMAETRKYMAEESKLRQEAFCGGRRSGHRLRRRCRAMVQALIPSPSERSQLSAALEFCHGAAHRIQLG